MQQRSKSPKRSSKVGTVNRLSRGASRRATAKKTTTRKQRKSMRGAGIMDGKSWGILRPRGTTKDEYAAQQAAQSANVKAQNTALLVEHGWDQASAEKTLAVMDTDHFGASTMADSQQQLIQALGVAKGSPEYKHKLSILRESFCTQQDNGKWVCNRTARLFQILKNEGMV